MEREPEGRMGLRQVDRGVDRKRRTRERFAQRRRLLDALNGINLRLLFRTLQHDVHTVIANRKSLNSISAISRDWTMPSRVRGIPESRHFWFLFQVFMAPSIERLLDR